MILVCCPEGLPDQEGGGALRFGNLEHHPWRAPPISRDADIRVQMRPSPRGDGLRGRQRKGMLPSASTVGGRSWVSASVRCSWASSVLWSERPPRLSLHPSPGLTASSTSRDRPAKAGQRTRQSSSMAHRRPSRLERVTPLGRSGSTCSERRSRPRPAGPAISSWSVLPLSRRVHPVSDARIRMLVDGSAASWSDGLPQYDGKGPQSESGSRGHLRHDIGRPACATHGGETGPVQSLDTDNRDRSARSARTARTLNRPRLRRARPIRMGRPAAWRSPHTPPDRRGGVNRSRARRGPARSSLRSSHHHPTD